MKKSFVFIFVLPMLSVAACAGTSERIIANPLPSGPLSESRIVHHNPFIEQHTNVAPGTYDDIATLSSLDAEGACFEVTMHMPAQAEFDFKLVSAALSARPGKVEIERAEIRVLPTVAKAVAGTTNVRVENGSQQVCYNRNPDGSCRGSYSEATYGSVEVPTLYQVREQSARLCFRHGGTINPTTTSLRLDIKQRGTRVAKFQWGLTPRI